jgi:ATP-dependent DNA ligase
MDLPVMPPLAPMLARLAHELPAGDDFLFEPKWDGFRCVVFRDRDELVLQSRNGKPLDRYFPELEAPLRAQLPERCVVDGELVIVGSRGLDFEALLLRIHPAKSRIERLAREIPAAFVAFDLIALGSVDLRAQPLVARRQQLEAALRAATPPLHLSPCTRDRAQALDWFHRFEGAGFDGVLAKPSGDPYVPGKRELIKVKHDRTADCVLGGFRIHKDGRGVGSLLLGLYDAQAELHHVGVATGLDARKRQELLATLEPYRMADPAGHPWAHGLDPDSPEHEGEQRLPGGKSRWTQGRDLSWQPVRPELVVEVAYDHMQGTRFRHATRFRNLRFDRAPESCTYAQLESVVPIELQAVFQR